MTAPLYHQDNESMNHNQHRVSRLLLAAAMALPLAALADEGDGAPTMHADAGPPCGPEAGPGHAGPGVPPPHFDGMRSGFDGGRSGRPPFGPPPGPGIDGIELPFLHGVELNEGQQDKVFAILHAEAPYLRDQGKAAEKAQAALWTLSDGAAYDDAKDIA